MVLRLNNVSKSFGERVILDSFSYTFGHSGLYFIIGESGVGKTTLLRIIAGLDTEHSGTVEKGGIGNVSFMFQEYRLFPTLSSLKNAAIASKSADTRVAEELLSRLGFSNEDMKKKPRELSGGMKQRVAFARAVLKSSPVLILDEPTKELDSETVSVMLDIIKEQAKQRVVIVVTHDDVSKISDTAEIIRLSTN